MQTKYRINMTIDKEIIDTVKPILRSAGLKMSTVVEVILKGIADTEAKPFTEVYSNMVAGFVGQSKDKKKKKKEQ